MGLLLITIPIRTLDHWVTYFARSFDAMARPPPFELGISRAQVLGEFKTVHTRHMNSEQPFAILELPSVTSRYPHSDRRELAGRSRDLFALSMKHEETACIFIRA